jgi:glycosyltransferase involved in cell wall biosynthesis
VVVHDYLTQRGGAERVALELAQHYGNELHTSLFSPEMTFPEFRSVKVREILSRLPDLFKHAKFLVAPLVGLSFLLTRVDAPVVLCSSSGWSHWVRTSGRKVVYCYSPPRWLYAEADYFHGRRPLGGLLSIPLALLRLLDRRMARQADTYLAISQVSADRVARAYGRSAIVIPPPVTFNADGGQAPVDGVDPGFFLTIARPRGYKNTDVAVEAFKTGGCGQLVVVGGAPDEGKAGPQVRFLGRVSEDELRWLYANCQATIGLSREDFGLTPVEGHLFGKPAIVVAAGGYLETCLDGINAVHVEEATVPALTAGLKSFAGMTFDAQKVRASAQQYSLPLFWAALERHTNPASA